MSEYVGRFAPSPTGPLHFGSLVAAVASYCDAKAANGKWLLRIEDLDKPREVKGASASIIHCLEAYGFVWDDDVVYQSQQTEHYEKALAQLQLNALVYPCTCTRKEIADSSSQYGIEGMIYPGTCRHGNHQENKPSAWRMRVNDNIVSFNDRSLGHIQHILSKDTGDFVVKRADGLFAYQLAVVVDDANQGITDIVRGADLLNSTTRQIYLQQALDLTTPSYLHIPIVKNAQGEKLSKQTLAKPLPLDNIQSTLFATFGFLGLQPPQTIKNATSSEMWRWAIQHWKVPNSNSTRYDT
jgi:glutamyl-Q tRNA(Asp) synthetase